nr:unnamed protein product [Callosobruchus analis]
MEDEWERYRNIQKTKFEKLASTKKSTRTPGLDTSRIVDNISKRSLSEDEPSFGKRGEKFAITPKEIPSEDIIANLESAIRTIKADIYDSTDSFNTNVYNLHASLAERPDLLNLRMFRNEGSQPNLASAPMCLFPADMYLEGDDLEPAVVSSLDSECLDLSIKGFYLIIYYPYSDPGQEFEIISEQDLVNTWEFLERGSHKSTKNSFAPRLLGTRLIEVSSKIQRHVVKVMDRDTQTEDLNYEKDYLKLKKKYEELKVELEKFTSGVSAWAGSPPPKALLNVRTLPLTCEGRVKLVQIGSSGTKVEKHIFDSINWNSYTAATRKLLISLFPRKILATHSLTGKPSPALDPSIINDIIEVVSKKCKVPESLVRSAITTKCADENKLYRKRLQKRSNTDSLLADAKPRL